jgi:hypothetical protein
MYLFLFGFETLFPTPAEGHSRRLPDNQLLRRIFGYKREKVIRELRKLRNEELHNLYFSPNVGRENGGALDGWGT